jgi:SHS family lactate transporter-like MFS transporter
MNELSPASVRGLFPGFVYQLGVLVVSPATMIELEMCNIWGYSWALAAFAVAIIVILVFLFYFGPEEHGKDFSDSRVGPFEMVGE